MAVIEKKELPMKQLFCDCEDGEEFTGLLHKLNNFSLTFLKIAVENEMNMKVFVCKRRNN